MCGIIAYNGRDDAMPYLVDGIRNLEYRGYDSCGCAFQSTNGIQVRKDVGRVDDVIRKYQLDGEHSNTAMFHTRWATNGPVSVKNAHPISDCTGEIAVVHNGIVENWAELKESLSMHKFRSDTDTEVIAHIVEDRLNKGGTLREAAKYAYKNIKGASSFLVMKSGSDEIVAVKHGSPLVLGLSKNGHFISSDIPSFSAYTNKVIYLHDGDLVSITKSGYSIMNMAHVKAAHKISYIKTDYTENDRSGFKHFMIKEIMEQPRLIKQIVKSDISALEKSASVLNQSKTVYLVGAGTSFHVALIGAHNMRLNGINAIAIQPQDAKDYSKVFKKDDVFIIVSQSGETADIISMLPLIKENKKLGILNSAESTLARAVDIPIFINAGHEKGVAATKTFTLSSIYLVLLSMFASGNKEAALRDLRLLSLNIYNLFVPSVLSSVSKAASILKKKTDVFYLGKGLDYAIALEGALKMKEVSYLHAEAIDTATFRHGPLALISNGAFAVSIVSRETKQDAIRNLREVKARKGKIIGISYENSDVFDIFIKVPEAGNFSFIQQAIVTQLLSYKVSVLRGIDPDHPRNLAKSVTVK
ncbi:glutamine--fructose-6-phosphate transaminase (isomerizing) [Candidatus Parvarchaeota archaeon]|nr:glutamine--fructose-6-phosphate transaminase (isomerizing) [Candidatus Parvarchaeota archaeon]